MKLTRLEIFGFKSFAKKFDLKLSGGITAIVGPNGCGKSNVVDAIRWVLGEQRPSQIRLDQMEDVIFKGSTNRRPLGMSEVSLTIENITGLLPVDMSEITLTRRLFRSGESGYLINKKPCRLADINDLLMDTGMGTDSYSVFELAMINSILSDKTEDRRHIFEEAAGITKYKARRKSALNKLINIEDDLNRVGDIIIELQRRVDSLKRQASKARKYRNIKSEIKSRTIAVASFEIEKHKQSIAEVNAELEKVRSSLEFTRTGISRSMVEIERLSVESINVEKELEEIVNIYNNSMEIISEKDKELARFDSRLESLDENVMRAREVSKRNTSELENLAESSGDCDGNLADVTKHLEKIEISFRGINEQYKKMNKQITDKSSVFSEFENEYRRMGQEIASLKATHVKVNVKWEENKRRLGEIDTRSEELGNLIVTLNHDLDRFNKQKHVFTQEEQKHSHKLNIMKNALNENIEKLERVDNNLRNALGKQSRLKAEKDFFEEIIRSYEGYSDGVKNAARAQHMKGRIFGVLADHISSDVRYVPAIEAALSGCLQYILVNTIDDAVEGARYLSKEMCGRAAFIPLDIKESIHKLSFVHKAPGVIGPAHEFIRTEARFMPVIKRLLEGVYIVESLDIATKLHLSRSDLRYITLAGEIVGTNGDIHGGSIQDEREKTLGRMEKLNKLTATLKMIDSDAQKIQEKQSELSGIVASLRASIGEEEKTIETIRVKITDLSNSETHTSAKKDAGVETLNNLRSEAETIRESFCSLESEKETITEELSTSESMFSKIEEALTTVREGLEYLRAEFERHRSAITAYEVERATLVEKKASLCREFEVIREHRESLAQSSSRTHKEIENIESEIITVSERKKNLVEEIEKLELEHESLKTQRNQIEKHFADIRSKRSEKERELQNLRHELGKSTGKESSLILARDEAAMVIKNILERLSDEYFISSEDIPPAPDATEFNPDNEKLLLENLRHKLRAIGDVNLAAEADYDEEKKRLDFLEHERDDLVEADNTLKETVTKINNIARARFMETFERIRNNFEKVFQEFFAGGECDLTLEENIDPLEASIRIAARPSGKNVRSINLLSSGERALTAISLLFAIYLVKPSPYCILDEIDAPLDDANIVRYLRVIRDFAQKTQFIMVTHNKKTMAEADNLYGITMAEPGLSSLVSVLLSEVDVYENNGGTKTQKREIAVTPV